MTPTSKKHLWKAPALAASASLIISPMMAIPAFAAETTSIAAIQGTGAASPLVNQTVTTRGVVTAVYNQGDLREDTLFRRRAPEQQAPRKGLQMRFSSTHPIP